MGQTMQDEDVQIPVTELLAALLEKEGSDPPHGRRPAGAVRARRSGASDGVSDPHAARCRARSYAILPQKMREKFEQELELDMSYALPGKAGSA